MKYLTLLSIALFWTHATLASQEAYSEYFSGEGGFRIDYSIASPKGSAQKDDITLITHIQIPAQGEVANINLMSIKNKKIQLEQSFQGVILKRTKSIIYIIVDQTSGDNAEKIEAYVVFPEKGTGFILTASCYLGMPIGKLAATQDNEFPYGSGLIIKLKKMDI